MKKRPRLEFITKNPREAAALCLYFSEKKKCHVADLIREWENRVEPKGLDCHLARELAFGIKKRELSLDFLAKKIQKKKAKGLRKILLNMAIYQYVFLSRIPLYAIANETVEIAKKYTFPGFASFLNAVIKQFDEIDFSLDQELEVSYSFPQKCIDLIKEDYPEQYKELLERFNETPSTMVRIRPGFTLTGEFEELGQFVGKIIKITDPSVIMELAKSKQVYIQNITSAYLMQQLYASYYVKPERILDLCAAPGGKLLMAHDLFPEAKLWANDAFERRLDQLIDNCDKYDLDVQICNQRAESFLEEGKFDLILLDVPCSNSGVLQRRVEARYHINATKLEKWTAKQFAMLRRAKKLLKKEGQIWYLTCSIFKAENEKMMQRAVEELGFKVVGEMQAIIPSSKGWDGGFGCALTL